jgi:hypothetical protein
MIEQQRDLRGRSPGPHRRERPQVRTIQANDMIEGRKVAARYLPPPLPAYIQPMCRGDGDRTAIRRRTDMPIRSSGGINLHGDAGSGCARSHYPFGERRPAYIAEAHEQDAHEPVLNRYGSMIPHAMRPPAFPAGSLL